jgi:hypothetical protein
MAGFEVTTEETNDGQVSTRSNAGRILPKVFRLQCVIKCGSYGELGTNVFKVHHVLGGDCTARYWDAVQRYLQTGDTSRLKKFEGKKVKGGC